MKGIYIDENTRRSIGIVSNPEVSYRPFLVLSSLGTWKYSPIACKWSPGERSSSGKCTFIAKERTETSELDPTPPLCGHLDGLLASGPSFMLNYKAYIQSPISIYGCKTSTCKTLQFTLAGLFPSSTQQISYCQQQLYNALFNTNSHKHEMDQRSHWATPWG